jgi:hypothetical protein
MNSKTDQLSKTTIQRYIQKISHAQEKLIDQNVSNQVEFQLRRDIRFQISQN